MKPKYGRSLNDAAYEKRMRERLWHGLFGVAARLLDTRNPGERKRCEERLAMYVTKLREAGVEVVPDENG